MKLGSFGLNDRRAFFHCTSSLITSSILIPPALADELSVPEPVDYTAVALDIANLVSTIFSREMSFSIISSIQ